MKDQQALVKREFASIKEHLGCPSFDESDWREFTFDPTANSRSGLTLTRLRAEQGFPKAQFRLGLHYAFSIQVEKDYKQAANWFLKAAKQGHAYAQLHVGMAYANGEGVPESIEDAFFWVSLSAGSCREAREWKARFGERLASDRRTEIEQRCRYSPYLFSNV